MLYSIDSLIPSAEITTIKSVPAKSEKSANLLIKRTSDFSPLHPEIFCKPKENISCYQKFSIKFWSSNDHNPTNP